MQRRRGDARDLPLRAHGAAHEELLRQGAAIDRREPGAARPPEQRIGRAEQPVESVDEPERDRVLALAPTLVTTQDAQLADGFRPRAARQLVTECLDQCGAVEEAEI